MPRLIDAEILKNHYAWWEIGDGEITYAEAKKRFDTIIDVQPTVDPFEHGHWDIDYEMGIMTCSECGTEHMYYNGADEDQQYCSQCGARMDE